MKYLSKVKENFDLCRGVVQGITALCRIFFFFATSVVIIYSKGIDINKYFDTFPGIVKYNITLKQTTQLTNTRDYFEVYNGNEVVRYLQVSSSIPLIVLLIQMSSSFLSYFSGKIKKFLT